jgi:hypothetical protein
MLKRTHRECVLLLQLHLLVQVVQVHVLFVVVVFISIERDGSGRTS